MSLLKIEQYKQISIKCKELIIFLSDENEISFIKGIYDNSEKIINDFNKLNITIINPTPTEIGKWHSAIKSYARSYFKNKVKIEYPKKVLCCLDCKIMEENINKFNEKNYKLDNYFRDYKYYEYCDNCDKKWTEYEFKYEEAQNSNAINTDFLYEQLKDLKIDKYWMDANILLNRSMVNVCFPTKLEIATREIIKTEILKQISTIKIN